MSRAMIARMLSNSFFEVLCCLTSLFVSNCVQVTLFTFHELKTSFKDARQETIALSYFLAKFTN